ncbi:MAG: tRNA 2-thiouridine(34) synthase MnmA [Oscillospiraceae bacterium]|nr:tRNA 2-thiouridine(34) synthase MnmA [Oscillospiraceae bacterium]
MKVVVGFSGGVDSAVTTRLLQQAGHQVHGLYMDNTDEAARREAKASAERMGIELTVIDVKSELEEKVCRPFTESYLRGETPNPCILCNPSVKFRQLIALADRIGAEKVATGHYARAENGALYKGMPANDQSYMLCRLTREQAARLILPLGVYEKTQVRAMAVEWGLDAAHKPDSMEICFIPDKNYIRWMSERAELPGPGDFVFHGKVIGQHEGIFRWTVGQKRPGLYEGRKLYVSRIDGTTNTVELALWEELFQKELLAVDFNWLINAPVGKTLPATVRVRHTKWEEPRCTVMPEGESVVSIRCEEPVRAPAPGQSAVLYDGQRLLGGGFLVGKNGA